MRRGRLFCALALLGLVAFAWRAASAPPEAQAVWAPGEDMIRLHVVAASDSLADQQTKLAVRDALLIGFGDALAQGNYGAACVAVQENLDAIRQTAVRAARARGFTGDVEASFGLWDFPTRQYGDLRVPAGTYTALRVVLGAGQGRNWWCVLYPALCLSDADALETQQAAWPGARQEPAQVRFTFPLWQRLIRLLGGGEV
ncbi:MAG: stage II sporulation protein R [Oscillospiraceae bacterium]|jgi:stage II sporulation protein R|nr:stage II sporulation protein R [Oscillospiraceae bacterium]